ncbi:MAG: bifunctional oligoribonuclease/PAP phosphatase NrnA [Candidatus Omnitrophica bacterium]|nr:bifunctional oligoribonuclease/PAP phosphatase NrnA [Candidatus Omnitrophota bacterium]
MGLKNTEDFKKVVEVFKTRDNFVLASHVNPEGDSIGSQLAVYQILRALGKKAVIVNQMCVPDNLKFLPDAGCVTPDLPKDFSPETVIILDCPVLDRVGNIKRLIEERHFVVNVDHHISNEFFGEVNWVEKEASSVGEMIFYLIKEVGLKIDLDMAKVIYAAIVTDTGRFNYDNTRPATHRVVSELIEAGVRPKIMYSEIFEKKSAVEIRLLGKTLSTLKLDANGQIAYMSLTRSMYEEEGVDFVSTDEFINFPRSIKGVEVSIFFKENSEIEQKINVSFRSRGRVDVNVVASFFGGGGHAQVSGCVLDSPLEDAQKKVIKKVKEILTHLNR